MTKTFCDRCGKEIVENRKYAWLNYRKIYARMKLVTHEMRQDWEDDDKYICPECENEFIHWFMHPNEKNTLN